ncbi:MAG TPA: histidine phosphatase family protein [Microvirga sp.]|nr:histidine phosphatase family protein [Microvirga sp.]
MTTTFHLVRHAAHDRVGSVLCGRMPGVHLGEVGREQARRLARRFANENVASVQTSPLERARETAEPIAAATGAAVAVNEGILEIEFGEWTGRTFETLGGDARWAAWNGARAVNRPPGGEAMLEVQARVIAALEALRAAYPDRTLVVVSHADVIKAALLYHLGLPVDAYGRFDIDPASVSTLAVGDWGSRLIRMNEVAAA